MKNEFDFQEEFRQRLDEEALARKILGVSGTADRVKIKKAFWQLAIKFHPDKNPGNEKALWEFKKILNAYKFLCGEEDFAGIYEDASEEDNTLSGKYNSDNPWGFFSMWKETFMDDYFGNSRTDNEK